MYDDEMGEVTESGTSGGKIIKQRSIINTYGLTVGQRVEAGLLGVEMDDDVDEALEQLGQLTDRDLLEGIGAQVPDDILNLGRSVSASGSYVDPMDDGELEGLGELAGFWSSLGKGIKKIAGKYGGAALKTGLSFIPGVGPLAAKAAGFMGGALSKKIGKYGKRLLRKGVSRNGTKALMLNKSRFGLSAMKSKIAKALFAKRSAALDKRMAQQNARDRTPNRPTNNRAWKAWIRRAKGRTKALRRKESNRRVAIYRQRQLQERTAQRDKARARNKALLIQQKERARRIALRKQSRRIARQEAAKPSVIKAAKIEAERRRLAMASKGTPPGFRPVYIPKGATVKITAGPDAATAQNEYGGGGKVTLRSHRRLGV